MKSKARRTIEKWTTPNHEGKFSRREPTYLAPGQVMLVPSHGGDSTHHIVARLERSTPKKFLIEWVCSCKGFWYSEVDECRHVRLVKEAYEAAKAKLEAEEAS